MAAHHVRRAPRPVRAHPAGRCRPTKLVGSWMLLALALASVQQSCSFAELTFAPFSESSHHRRPPTRRASPTSSSESPHVVSFGSYYLSDLPTPAFLVDVDAARSVCGEFTKAAVPHGAHLLPSDCPWEPIAAEPPQALMLAPVPLSSVEQSEPRQETATTPHEPRILLREPFGQQFGEPHRHLFYLHSRVVRGRQEVRDDGQGGEGAAPAVAPTFLCELDLPRAHHPLARSHASAAEEDAGGVGSGMPIAELVLGLNNHHVGSYYWARSAGSGAAMEAPGVELANNGYVLRWKDADFAKCNTNDGKRSEWVHYLRAGDQVQLVPTQRALRALIRYYTAENRVYGVSVRGRPLGSEPIVVCRYELRTNLRAD